MGAPSGTGFPPGETAVGVIEIGTERYIAVIVAGLPARAEFRTCRFYPQVSPVVAVILGRWGPETLTAFVLCDGVRVFPFISSTVPSTAPAGPMIVSDLAAAPFRSPRRPRLDRNRPAPARTARRSQDDPRRRA